MFWGMWEGGTNTLPRLQQTLYTKEHFGVRVCFVFCRVVLFCFLLILKGFFGWFLFRRTFFSLAAVINQTALDPSTPPRPRHRPCLVLPQRGRLDRLLQEPFPADVAPRWVGDEGRGASLLGLSPLLKSAGSPPSPSPLLHLHLLPCPLLCPADCRAILIFNYLLENGKILRSLPPSLFLLFTGLH